MNDDYGDGDGDGWGQHFMGGEGWRLSILKGVFSPYYSSLTGFRVGSDAKSYPVPSWKLLGLTVPIRLWYGRRYGRTRPYRDSLSLVSTDSSSSGFLATPYQDHIFIFA